jgi:protoporphyrinogen oxidase
MGRAAVVGGGLLGLAVAHRLRERGDDVTVFEASPDLDSGAKTWEHDGFTWDRQFDAVSPSDKRTLQLLNGLGLEHDVRWARTTRALYAEPGPRLRPFSDAVDLIALDTIGVTDKVRVVATLLAVLRQHHGDRLERVPADEWLIRWSGRRAFDRVWRPLLHANLGEQWRRASAAFVWSQLRRSRASRHGVRRVERLGYVPGGNARVLHRYAEVVTDAGVKIDAGQAVHRITSAPDGLSVELDGASPVFDRVVVTTAAPAAADLCPGLEPDELRRLRAVRYTGSVCASVLVKRRPSSYTFTYVDDAGSSFTSAVDMSAFLDPEELGGWYLLYLRRCAAPDDPIFDASDDAIRQDFLRSLRAIAPGADPSDVGAFRIARSRRAFAVPGLRYSRTRPATTTSIPGLQLISPAYLPFAAPSANEVLELLQELRRT